uniref:Zinc finger protein 276 n=1 Tax=Fundulus heteroclitus TaxID=8078 RepID=A0A3Q2P618_FUNHE
MFWRQRRFGHVQRREGEDISRRMLRLELPGRLSTAVCRLCHGKFSPRSLRHAFNKWPQDSLELLDSAAQSPLLFHTDFQRLVGVQLDRDPQLSEFICKKCHTKFYKCHSILIRFLQRVNLPLLAWCLHGFLSSISAPTSFTSDPKCLHSLVSWAHRHAEACRSCPDLKEVLEGQCWGSVKAVWGCVDGHRYIMDAQCATASLPGHRVECRRGALRIRKDDVMSEEEEESFPEEAPSPAAALQDRTADSDLSDRLVSGVTFKGSISGFFKLNITNKKRQSTKSSEEPRVRKKPGPKPGWKNKFKPKGEELPNIYKCPYQGCTAVYRAPDGLKKHIKEHHEDMRERPCPHPGCNKVFMIDRYLQRHVKLIHTETFLFCSLQNHKCEVCGFQCRQRASLKYHMTKHKAEADLEFECLVCRKRFEKAHNLNVHMSMVHPLTQQQPAGLQSLSLTPEAAQQDQDR